MFIKELNDEEKLVFLNLVAYSCSVGKMMKKDEEDEKEECFANIVKIDRIHSPFSSLFGGLVALSRQRSMCVDCSKILLEYFCEMEFEGTEVIRSYAQMGLAYVEIKKPCDANRDFPRFQSCKDFISSVEESLVSEVIPAGFLYDVLVNKSLSESFYENFDSAYNLPKELRLIKNKKIFLCEVLNFYDRISFDCWCKEDFIDQVCYFLRLDEECLKEC